MEWKAKFEHVEAEDASWQADHLSHCLHNCLPASEDIALRIKEAKRLYRELGKAIRKLQMVKVEVNHA